VIGLWYEAMGNWRNGGVSQLAWAIRPDVGDPPKRRAGVSTRERRGEVADQDLAPSQGPAPLRQPAIGPDIPAIVR